MNLKELQGKLKNDGVKVTLLSLGKKLETLSLTLTELTDEQYEFIVKDLKAGEVGLVKSDAANLDVNSTLSAYNQTQEVEVREVENGKLETIEASLRQDAQEALHVATNYPLWRIQAVQHEIAANQKTIDKAWEISNSAVFKMLTRR